MSAVLTDWIVRRSCIEEQCPRIQMARCGQNEPFLDERAETRTIDRYRIAPGRKLKSDETAHAVGGCSSRDAIDGIGSKDDCPGDGDARAICDDAGDHPHCALPERINGKQQYPHQSDSHCLPLLSHSGNLPLQLLRRSLGPKGATDKLC